MARTNGAFQGGRTHHLANYHGHVGHVFDDVGGFWLAGHQAVGRKRIYKNKTREYGKLLIRQKLYFRSKTQVVWFNFEV